jgi:4-amino-4-deoxy-L-arabinose transferase-like glycosyltransferase
MISNKKLLAVVFLISILSGFFWNQKIFGQPVKSDQVVYDGIAQDLVTRGTYTYQGQETSAEPVYPFFLAGVYTIFGHNYDAVRVIQIVLFAITVCILYSIANSIAGIRVALSAALLTSFYYPLVNQAGLLLQETLFTFLLVLLVYSLYRAQTLGKWWWLLSGILLGLATLTKGSIQFFFVFIIAYLVWVYRKDAMLKYLSHSAAIFAVGLVLIVGPWLAREKFMGGGLGVAPRGGGTLLALTEVTERMSHNYLGNFIGFSFGYYFAQKLYPDIDPVAFRDTSVTTRKIETLTAQGKSLRDVDSILLAEAKHYLLAHPFKYGYMAVLNFINLNSPVLIKGPLWQNVTAVHPMYADGRHPELPEIVKAAVVLGVRFVWFTLFSLVGYGIWVSRKSLVRFSWMLLLIAYLNIFYSLVWTVPRYAQPMYPFYFILAMVGISHLWLKYKARILVLL